MCVLLSWRLRDNDGRVAVLRGGTQSGREVTLCKATARTFKAGQQYSDMPDRGGCCAFDHNNLAGFPVRRSPHVLLGDLGKRDAECWLRTAWVLQHRVVAMNAQRWLRDRIIGWD
jgi:hypothetical protein